MLAGKVLFGHPTMNENSRAAAMGVAEAGLLGELHTLLDTSIVARFAWGRLGRQLARRQMPPVTREYVQSHPAFEVYRLATQRLRHSSAAKRRMVDRAYELIDKRMARALDSSYTGVYAYEDGALEVFRRARELGVERVYDLPIGYWRVAQEILSIEAEALPEWAGTMPSAVDAKAKLSRKEEELELAQHIVVASSFTRSTLEGGPARGARVAVIPYGAPSPVSSIVESRSRQLKVLFVGGLSQRKGLSYLFEAVSRCGEDVELTVVGAPAGHSLALDRCLAQPNVRWLRSLPHQDVLRVMREHDVLVFPSLFEGYGLVISEALSQGLPVIATPHTAAPDLLTDGEDGWVVPIRDAEAIASRLSLLRDVDLRNRMKSAARNTAARLSWTAYKEETARFVSDSLGGKDVTEG